MRLSPAVKRAECMRELSVVLLVAEIHNDREMQENGGVLASNDMYGASQLCILPMAS
ncbi:MAG TPA: hypothetical protein VE199_03110 [Nitrososphaera sp.]|nr:hypothetical protein [Nitrososphaera sp.]